MQNKIENIKVSILIPMHNVSKYIEETITSALNQTWQKKEIIIIDDGSTDESYEIAKSFESEILKVYKQEKKGAPSARNLAFEFSSGDYIQYLDADDLMAPNKIEAQIKMLAEYSFDEDIIAFCGWIEFKDEDEIEKLRKRETIINKDYEPAYKALIDYWKTFFPSIPYHNYLTHRNKIKAVGKWREELTKNQDCEFFARVISSCKRMIYCDDTIVYYRDVFNSIKKADSEEKVYSELISNREIAKIILSHTKSKDAIYACSLQYTEYLESRYPLNKKFLKEAYNDMKKYGLNFITSHRGNSFKIFYSLFGWKRAMQLLKPYNFIKGLLFH
jgi:glycosyltransferase involved in cell wall biosynthesis